MPNTKYLAGRRYEYKTIEYLKRTHPTMLWVTRAAGSKGVWDVIGVADRFVVLVQVKCYEPALAERQAMWAEAKKIARPTDIWPQCHVWTRGDAVPEVHTIDAEFARDKRERAMVAGN